MQNRILALLMLVSVLGLAACASDTSVERFKVGGPYTIKGKTYYPEENYIYEETGLASWYGPGFNGKRTANGERFDEDAFTAAHRTLQLPSLVRVTNLENGLSIVVRVTDRGPFHGNRIMDVSKGAAKALGFLGQGTAKVKIQVLGPESKALSEAARRKIDTTGAEVAVNNTGMLDERFAQFYPSELMKALPPENTDVQVASANDYFTNDGMDGSPRPPNVVPQGQMQAMLTPAPTQSFPLAPTGGIDRISPSAGYNANEVVSGMPLPPELPPQRQGDDEHNPAIARTRSGGRYPGIPVAMLEPEDVVPKPSYNYAAVRPQHVPVSPTFIYVQAGSFTSSANAQRAQQQVASLGPTQILSSRFGGKAYYRVRIGPIESVDKADAMVNELQRQGKQAAIIVSEK